MHLLISAFPGTGKSSIFRDTRDLSGFFVRDSDSSTFDKNLFPENYIQHLREAPEGDAITLVSSHDVVREAMSQEGWDFAVVFPRVEDKAVYLQRYADRGSPAAFLDLMDKQWDTFQASVRKPLPGALLFELPPAGYLSDSLTLIVARLAAASAARTR